MKEERMDLKMPKEAEILSWLKEYFDKNKMDYEILPNNNIFNFIYPLDGKLEETMIFIKCMDGELIAEAFIKLAADEDCRLAVAEYITRVNSGFHSGKLVMDFSDGQIKFFYTKDCAAKTSLTDDSLTKIIGILTGVYNTYGDGLVAVVLGEKSPEEAIKDLECLYDADDADDAEDAEDAQDIELLVEFILRNELAAEDDSCGCSEHHEQKPEEKGVGEMSVEISHTVAGEPVRVFEGGSDSMATAQEIFGWIKEYFDKEELAYDLAENDNVLITGFSLSGKLKGTNMTIRGLDGCFTVNSFVEINADKDCRQRVAEYLMRATYGLTHGNFEMDYSDGEVSYRLTMNCKDSASLTNNIGTAIAVSRHTLEIYGDGLLAVMFGVKTPEEAIKDAELDSSKI